MPRFIKVPFTTDPETLRRQAYLLMQALYPGWVPNRANPDTIMLEAISLWAAELQTTASGVPVSIWRTLGRGLFEIPPIDATSATAQTTWTVQDDAGYTIEAGKLVGIRTAGDVLVPFRVQSAVTIAPGDTATATGEVTIVAVTPGAASSGLGADDGPVEPIDIMAFVTAVTQEHATAGGVDAETDDDYDNRLAARLQTLADRAILPRDFELLSRNVPGVYRALALDLYDPNTNEQQTITVTAATSGDLTLTLNPTGGGAQTTAAIAFDAEAADVQAALEALSNVAPGDVIVSGGPLSTAAVVVEYAGQYAETDVAEMTANGAGLVGGGAAVTIATIRQGSDADDHERTVTVVGQDDTGGPLSSPVKAALDAYLQALREVNFLVYVIDPTYTDVDVTYVVTAYAGYDTAAVEAAVDAAITAYLDPAAWGAPPGGDPRDWANRPDVRRLEVAQVINSVAGVDIITTLTIGLNGGAQTTDEVHTLAGRAPLPNVGTISGTVNTP